MASPGDQAIAGWFPNLQLGDYVITSPETEEYNCIAWAAGKTDAWWEPIHGAGYYWPDQAPWDHRIASLVSVFESLGYEECSSDALEDGFEKVAIYGIGDDYEHAARMLPDGKWTSKLGAYKDIEHKDLLGLTGLSYGSVAKVLRKKIITPNADDPHANPSDTEGAP